MKLAEEVGIRSALAAQNAAAAEPADQVQLAMDYEVGHTGGAAPAPAAPATASLAGPLPASRPGATVTNLEELLDVRTGVDETAEPIQSLTRQVRAVAQGTAPTSLLPFITPILREFGIAEVDGSALRTILTAVQVRIFSMTSRALSVARRRKEEHLAALNMVRNVAHSREILSPQFGLHDPDPSTEPRIVEKQDVILSLMSDSTPKSESLLSRLAKN